MLQLEICIIKVIDIAGLTGICHQYNGEEGGVRTPETLRFTRFPSVRIRPLCHLSKAKEDKLVMNRNQVKIMTPVHPNEHKLLLIFD